MDHSITTKPTLRFTEQEIKNFRIYEKIRSKGRYNMLDPRARMAAGLSREEFFFCITNYDLLASHTTNE